MSGSGKSSLVFDTLYAEGQRRYVETFSAYARQFLDRMDKPQVDRIEGVPPAIAIDQTNPVRTSRSTVGTMTELNDHLKLLFARAATLHCRGCGQPVLARHAGPASRKTLGRARRGAGDPRLVLTFPVRVPANFTEAEDRAAPAGAGLHAAFTHAPPDRTPATVGAGPRCRLARDASRRAWPRRIEAALHRGHGADSPCTCSTTRAPTREVWRFSSDLHCADCDIHYAEPSPSLFSFNSPIGACETCRGFGRVIGIDSAWWSPTSARRLPTAR